MLDQILECPDTFMPPTWNLCMASLNHALLITNASINFIIYTSMGDSFNKSLRQIFSRFSQLWESRGIIIFEIFLCRYLMKISIFKFPSQSTVYEVIKNNFKNYFQHRTMDSIYKINKITYFFNRLMRITKFMRSIKMRQTVKIWKQQNFED